MEPFRFVHAARLLLDHSLCGTGPLPDSIRPIVEDATLLAWDKVVEVCLAESVDLLLLAGDAAELVEQGLRGTAALIRGLEQLSARGITVVITGSASVPAKSWPAGLTWPDGVVHLEDSDEAAVQRDGKLLAIVRPQLNAKASPTDDTPRLLKLTSDDPNVFRILVSHSDAEWSPVDSRSDSSEPADTSSIEYHATGGGTTLRNITIGRRIVHDPGPPQAIRPLETGPRGCALVCVDEAGHWERTFVPTAPVRFESIHLTVNPDQTRDDLLLEMIVALERLLRYPSDRVWLLAVNVSGAGPCMEMFGNERDRDAFLSTFHADHGIRDVQIFVHAVRLHPTVVRDAETEGDDELIRQFDRRLTERVAHPQWALQRCLDESRLQGGPWAAPLRSLLAELDAGEIAADARRLGLEWFATEEGPSP
jgi:DNA repair protein SbcD/Mre11